MSSQCTFSRRSSAIAMMLVGLPLLACSGGDAGDLGGEPDRPDGGGAAVADAGGPFPDATPGDTTDGGGSGQLASTLTSTCAELRGRAVVNFNGNLGISFTEADSPFTFLGSIQFEIPPDFTGSIPNPENWDGDGSRQIVAVTSSNFELHGNHCWFDNSGASGSVTITDYRPSEGVVKADFDALSLRSCVGASICTVSGSIETTGQGVFE